MKIFNFIALIISAINCQIEVNQHLKNPPELKKSDQFQIESN